MRRMGGKAMSELKPCPFCSSEAKIFHEYERWSVYCDNLNCQIRTVGTWEHKTKKKAIEAWNRRAGDDK